ncbi:MAG TPA: hypothetical protein DEP91_01375 [Sphingomonas bacterium]|uniref:Sulfate ABC transporter substrate-binding protein n=1 Tax=Sphingomonas bacterium TaxID=1895847 RepID=A0A3D0W8G2_9SPHN|nr:hypothetical protein [Sphingomonas bacterium]
MKRPLEPSPRSGIVADMNRPQRVPGTGDVAPIALTRMRRVATGLLVAMAALFLFARTQGGAHPVWGYVQAFAEAAMVGGLADWFAVTALFRHVPVLDSGARGSTTTFVQRGIGDVLLAWENEAYLALEELGPDAFDIVTPTLSILAEPPVALVPGNAERKGNLEVAQGYLDYLYSDVGRAIAAKNYYRPFRPEAAAAEDIARFGELNLVTIADFGGWREAQPRFFGDGGVFDQIYSSSTQ